MRPRLAFNASARARASAIVTGMPTITNVAVTPSEVRKTGSPSTAAYCSSPMKFTENGERMSAARKSVNDIANDPTIGITMNTANTATNGSAKPHAIHP